MKLYREVLISSAEQAEALPVGTLARHAAGSGMDHAHKLGPLPGFDNSFMWISLNGSVPSPNMVGWTALVPIEAEEETRVAPEALTAAAQQTLARANRAAATGILPPDRLTIQQQTRHVTPWRAQD